ncbi:MAG: 30S ribosomal protein S16 [Chloroflexi bacterium]|nr:30S ribosomal protein S16 [Chloroflexota bacterium]
MVKLRLQRTGRKKRPSYRIVAADSRAPRDGSFVEIIGHYDTLTDPATVEIDEEKALKWLRDGAQSSPTVTSLLQKQGILDKFKSEKN